MREVRDTAGRRRAVALLQPRRDQPSEGKKHPWEREWSYGWSMMRIGAYLRRSGMDLLDRGTRRPGRALHVEGRKPHRPEVAEELARGDGARPGRGASSHRRPHHRRRSPRRAPERGLEGRLRRAHPCLRRRPGAVRTRPGRPADRRRRAPALGAGHRLARVPAPLRGAAAEVDVPTSTPSSRRSPPTSRRGTGSRSSARLREADPVVLVVVGPSRSEGPRPRRPPRAAGADRRGDGRVSTTSISGATCVIVDTAQGDRRRPQSGARHRPISTACDNSARRGAVRSTPTRTPARTRGTRRSSRQERGSPRSRSSRPVAGSPSSRPGRRAITHSPPGRWDSAS